jgi:hypothetical protein
MMSLFGGPPGAAPVSGPPRDVSAWNAVHDVVSVESEHHVVARAALEDVGAVEGLVRRGASLNRRVVLPVIVESDEELRPFGAFHQCRLRRMRRAEDQAHARGKQAGRRADAPKREIGFK